ncbi:MAG: flagellar hook-basal body complex protein FliE [Synergistaceae bacterium]|jgi:flagellar hook-basal body complex protein FliE|nr:flagellar hook-basal body complex protein FliE [Synergistaceae bacterium]
MQDLTRISPITPIEMTDLIPQKKRADNPEGGPSFSEVLKTSLLRVNDMQLDADNMIQRMSLGEVEDISEVSIAVEKAEMALRLMVQIRDKLLDAYQQIGRMSV